MNHSVRVPSANETVQKEKELLGRTEYGENCVRIALQVNLIQAKAPSFSFCKKGIIIKAHYLHYRIIVKFFQEVTYCM